MSSETKRPTIGRTVHFTLPPDYWQYVEDHDRVRPAIVTRVHPTPNLVNLRVIYDPSDVFMVSARAQCEVQEGIGCAGRWFWPPIQ
jgi:hypothetical protein